VDVESAMTTRAAAWSEGLVCVSRCSEELAVIPCRVPVDQLPGSNRKGPC
jgi:hypothetical protein